MLVSETSSHTWSSHCRFLSRLLKLYIKHIVLGTLWKALCKSMYVINNENNK